ncbi:dolichyl-phosphate-mannose--protein mannosyltransferase [Streptomyces winkii]|uniref:dolichyl-phosphate-mannose--protein mannosyltransferase n=1 Tax=Streptomyces winkii TaxID=3051178 RepID=UPI0028CFEA41|nr:phospholipid carrier-dependent glycosyltransferase [Streptomyces sp. DSM 40971]
MTTSDTAAESPPTQTQDPAPTWQARLRRFGYSARPRVGTRERLLAPFPKPDLRVGAVFGLSPLAAVRLARWSAWGAPLLVALVAGALRFWQLGSPHAVIFDETYYAKDAWSLFRYGYEGSWPDKANDQILAPHPKIPLSPDGAYVVHPPAGKWIIGIGESVFGLDPFGWRFMTALLGTLSVLMLCRIGRRLFRSTALGCLAGALMAVDGLHFVMSRTALLDLVLMFWVLAAFGCLLLDRDRTRAKLADALPTEASADLPPGGAAIPSPLAPSPLTSASGAPSSGAPPTGALSGAPSGGADVRPDPETGARLRLGLRPWRLAAGLCLGIGFATKWNGLYILAAFGLLTVLWDMGARRTAGAPRPFAAMLRRDALPAFASTVVVAFGTYIASWTGWFATSGGYFRDWAEKDGAGGPWGWLPGPLRSLWHYESEVYDFHVGLTSGHTYESNPWSWLILGRPVSYFYESPKAGHDGCTSRAEGCAREVLALGTPLLWWAACFAVLYALYRWVLRRDWRAGAVLCGIAAGYLPWFMYQERTIFLFYAVVFLPFLCLAVAMMLGALAGPPGVGERRRTAGIVASGVLVLLVVWNFVYFWPIYTGQTIPMDAWRNRMWFETWI